MFLMTERLPLSLESRRVVVVDSKKKRSRCGTLSACGSCRSSRPASAHSSKLAAGDLSAFQSATGMYPWLLRIICKYVLIIMCTLIIDDGKLRHEIALQPRVCVLRGCYSVQAQGMFKRARKHALSLESVFPSS